MIDLFPSSYKKGTGMDVFIEMLKIHEIIEAFASVDETRLFILLIFYALHVIKKQKKE
jgi:hypothetical protein